MNRVVRIKEWKPVEGVIRKESHPGTTSTGTKEIWFQLWQHPSLGVEWRQIPTRKPDTPLDQPAEM